MSVIIKKMETDDELRGKAFAHWKSWHEAYPGIISREYLDSHTLDRCEKLAFRWGGNILVAKDGDQVVGFIGYGDRAEEAPDTGSVFRIGDAALCRKRPRNCSVMHLRI